MLIAMAMFVLAAQTPNALPSTPTDTSQACHQSNLVKITPADMLQRLDDFRDKLPAADRLRLDQALPRDADGGITECDKTEGSRASCEAAAYMPALRATGLMPQFLATIRPAS